MKKPNIVLVGVGKFGTNHLRVLNELEKDGLCNLYGVVDVNANILNHIKKKYEVKTSTKLDDFLVDKVDAFDVVSPTHTHFSIGKKCLNSGKHVMIEKPLTTSYIEAKELVQMAKDKSKILMTGHIFRYNKAVWKIKSLIEKGELGKIYYLYGHFMGFSIPRVDMGVIYNLMIHHIDTYNYLLKMLPWKIYCCVGHFLGRAEFEDFALLTLEYPPNLFGIIEGSWMSPGKQRDLTIVGSKKAITCDLLKQSIEIHDIYMDFKGEQIIPINKGITKIQLKYEEPLKLELTDFINSINTGKEPLANGKSVLDAILISEMALKSARLRREVEIDEI